MRNFLKAVSASTVCLAVAIAVARADRLEAQRANQDFATDGGFRDGLYLGRLTAQQGRPNQPPIGRWSAKHDRDSFLAGYLQAYQAASASGELANARR